jgi:hypothetical protein
MFWGSSYKPEAAGTQQDDGQSFASDGRNRDINSNHKPDGSGPVLRDFVVEMWPFRSYEHKSEILDPLVKWQAEEMRREIELNTPDPSMSP